MSKPLLLFLLCGLTAQFAASLIRTESDRHTALSQRRNAQPPPGYLEIAARCGHDAGETAVSACARHVATMPTTQPVP